VPRNAPSRLKTSIVPVCIWATNNRLPSGDFTGDIGRFNSRDRYAAYNGTAPIERSSGVHRVSQRGNRRLNHALHMVAICQIRHPHSDGRAFFDRKVAEGKTKKDAIRSLKRHLSNTVYRRLVEEWTGIDAADVSGGRRVLRHRRRSTRVAGEPEAGPAPTTRLGGVGGGTDAPSGGAVWRWEQGVWVAP
jgi:hypothetical protein